MNTNVIHPLINKDVHKYKAGEKTPIEILESTKTVNEMLSFCEISIFKYTYLKTHNSATPRDLAKLKNYTAYKEVLDRLKKYGFGEAKVMVAYNYTGMHWEYK